MDQNMKVRRRCARSCLWYKGWEANKAEMARKWEILGKPEWFGEAYGPKMAADATRKAREYGKLFKWTRCSFRKVYFIPPGFLRSLEVLDRLFLLFSFPHPKRRH
jgi:hypothetical protein